MQFLEAHKKLIASKEFKEWKHKHPKDFLAHGFLLDDDLNKDTWQVGFYDQARDSMTTFFVSALSIAKSESSEIFKRPDAKIEELDVSHLLITSDDAFAKAKKLQQEKYAADIPQKQFMIVQTLEGKAVYNVTLLTASFKTINIRIDAKEGKVLFEKMTSLMEFSVS